MILHGLNGFCSARNILCVPWLISRRKSNCWNEKSKWNNWSEQNRIRREKKLEKRQIFAYLRMQTNKTTKTYLINLMFAMIIFSIHKSKGKRVDFDTYTYKRPFENACENISKLRNICSAFNLCVSLWSIAKSNKISAEWKWRERSTKKEKDPNPINKFDFMKRKCFSTSNKKIKMQPNNAPMGACEFHQNLNHFSINHFRKTDYSITPRTCTHLNAWSGLVWSGPYVDCGFS